MKSIVSRFGTLALVVLLSMAALRAGDIGGVWFKGPRMPTARQELSTAALNGEIFTIAGYDIRGASTNTVEVFNTDTGAWRTAASFPIATNHNAAAVAAGTLYAFGGTSRRAFAYDPDGDAWVEVASMNYQHGNTPAVGVIDDRIYVAGGDGPGSTQRELEVYDPFEDTWTVLSPMNVPRNHTAGGVIEGKFYVVGGRPGSVAASALEVYDPDNDAWTVLTPMPTGRSGIGAGVVNGKMYVFGGEQPRLFSEVEVYDPVTDRWRQLPPMPTPRHGIFASVIASVIYLPGGATQQGFGATNINEFFVVTAE